MKFERHNYGVLSLTQLIYTRRPIQFNLVVKAEGISLVHYAGSLLDCLWRKATLADMITDSYDSKEVILSWWDDNPIEIHDGKLQLPQFELKQKIPHRCVEAYKTGNHHHHHHHRHHLRHHRHLNLVRRWSTEVQQRLREIETRKCGNAKALQSIAT